MSVSIVAIRSFLTALPSVSVHDSTDDLFFFKGEEQKFPFATIVAHDDPHDAFSNLSRPGTFRLNFVTNKAAFGALFPNLRTKADLTNANLDYQVLDEIFPHPVYGNMRWVSVINPNSAWRKCEELLVKAHKIRELRPNSW